jgi:hypothetical protein
MKLHQINFSIASRNYFIESNFDVRKLLLDPQPYNLHINYSINNQVPGNKFSGIRILKSNKKIAVSVSDGLLEISGDIEPMFKSGYNRQFGLFGNKGLINKFILHTLEKNYATSVLHASAIVHPILKKICIAVGASGSGKSVFVSNAIKAGWGILATEHVLISSELNLYVGNKYDNISPRAVEYFKNNLPAAKIFSSKKLVEPVGSKVFVNLGAYTTPTNLFSLDTYEIVLVVLNFGNKFHKKGSPIRDEDFILRVMQQIASEKINSPVIFDNQIFDIPLYGNAQSRSKVVNHLIEHSHKKIILGGDYSDFSKWLVNEFKS